MQNELKRISVIGLGKLGTPLAVCFASKGFPTIGLDVDMRKVEAINNGITTVYEPDLQDLLESSKNQLTATRDYEKAVVNSDVTFIVVLTPSDNRGGFSLKYVLEAGEEIGVALRKKSGFHLVVLTSTVMPGATEGKLRPLLEARSGKKCGQDFGLCYSPEFIALGTVIRDFLNPDFLLIGESDARSGEMLKRLYQGVCNNNPPVVRMNFVNAELTKLAVNTFMTTKITFANTLARICERLPGANVDVVAAALGLDSRIGGKYLKGAVGYGGPCFPRDNLALVALARSIGAPATLAESTDFFNQQQVPWLEQLVRHYLPKSGKVGILGLAYKPHSDVVEESQGMLLAEALVRKKISVIAYDPIAMKNAKPILGTSVTFAKSAEECVRETDVIALITPWEEFKRLSLTSFTQNNKSRVLIDCWRLLPAIQQEKGVTYIPLGIGGFLNHRFRMSNLKRKK